MPYEPAASRTNIQTTYFTARSTTKLWRHFLFQNFKPGTSRYIVGRLHEVRPVESQICHPHRQARQIRPHSRPGPGKLNGHFSGQPDPPATSFDRVTRAEQKKDRPCLRGASNHHPVKPPRPPEPPHPFAHPHSAQTKTPNATSLSLSVSLPPPVPPPRPSP